jgi:hypothetical protein
MSPLEAKFILQRLVQISFAVPVQPDQPQEEGIVLRTVDQEDGKTVLPAFTHPSLLSVYARQMRWLTGELLPSHCMEAKELFAHMAQIAGVELAVNPPTCPLLLTPEDCDRLSRNLLPDLSKLIGAPPGLSTSSGIMRAMGFEPASHLLPDNVISSVKLSLFPEPSVEYACLYTIGPAESAPEIFLGVKFSIARCPMVDKLLEKIQLLVARMTDGKPMVRTVMLEDPTEPQIRLRVAPFFKRG